MEIKENSNPQSLNKEEIDLIELLLLLWDKRTLIYKTTTIFIILGLIISLLSINKYISEAKLLPEISNKEGGVSSLMKQFGGLGSLAGIDLNSMNSSDALNPTLYPEIIKSTPFMIHLLQTNIYVPATKKSVPLYYYMTNIRKSSIFEIVIKYSLGLPGTIKQLLTNDQNANIGSLHNDSLIRMSIEMTKTIEKLNECVVSTVNMETGIITISAEFQDPEIAAQVASKTVAYLTQYVTEYRIQKVRENLNFISEQCELAKVEFNKVQNARSIFLDENKNIISAKIESEKQILQSHYDLTYNTYNNLLIQREQAKIKVQEETPIFKVLNPIQVPVEKSKPARSLIVLLMAFIGALIGIGIIIAKHFISMNNIISKESTYFKQQD